MVNESKAAARRSALFLAAMSSMGGCQYVSGLDELEIVRPEADAAVDVSPVDTIWGCLGQPRPEPTPTVEYRNSIRRLSDYGAVTDAEVKLCRKRDDPCADPIQTLRLTDGTLTFSIDGSFDGYIEVSSPLAMPAVIELTRPLGSMKSLPELLMIDSATLNRFTEAMKAAVDATLGHALFWAEDCQGRRAKGVTVASLDSLAPNSGQYYVTNALPSVSVDRTESLGGGGFINLPTGFRTFQAFLADDHRAIAPPHTARIREGYVTYFVFEPN